MFRCCSITSGLAGLATVALGVWAGYQLSSRGEARRAAEVKVVHSEALDSLETQLKETEERLRELT